MFRLPGFSPLRLFLPLLLVCVAAPCAVAQVGAGSLDPDYAPILTAEGAFLLAAPAQSGAVWVAGNFQFVNGVGRSNFARLRADGTVDPLFVADLSSQQNLQFSSVSALADGAWRCAMAVAVHSRSASIRRMARSCACSRRTVVS